MRTNQLNNITMALGKAGLNFPATAITAAVLAFDFCLAAIAYTKGAATTASSATDVNGDAYTPLGPDQGCTYLFMVNAAGVVEIAQGDVKNLDPQSGGFDSDGQLGEFPGDYDNTVFCPFAYVVAKYTGAATFTPAVDNWDLTGLTLIVQDIATLPDRPTDS